MSSTFGRVVALLVSSGSIGALGQTISPQIRADPTAPNGFAANETTASSSEFNPDRIVAAWNDWRRSPNINTEVINMGVGLSFDGGQSWTDFVLRPPAANQSGVEGDPMTAYDDRTGALWAGAISFAGNGGVYVARIDANQNTFNASKMARATGGADKCWMAAGPLPGNPNSTRVYITYNEGCLRSDTMGDTWSAPVNLGSGIGFQPRVGSDGTLYVTYWDFGTGLWLKRSADGGVTFTAAKKIATRLDTWGTQDGSRFPGNFRVPPWAIIACHQTNPNIVYAMFYDTTNVVGSNRNVNIYFTKSVNKGDTWSVPKVVNTDTNVQDQFDCWIEADSAGRLHAFWWDGRHTPAQNDVETNSAAKFDDYYAYSLDDGATWTEKRLSPAPWDAFNDGLNRTTQFIGDYNGIAQAGNRIVPVYLDSKDGDANIYVNSILFCLPDFNKDGFLTGDDFDLYVAAFELGLATADYNGDGFVTGDDFDSYAADFEAGC